MRGLQFARLLVLLALSGDVRTYNVDDRARTVLTSGLSESSAAEELFGFSMAHHRYSDGSQALFVGAPHAIYNDPQFGNLSMGQVYKCEIANGSQCQPDPIFNTLNDLEPTSFSQPKPYVLTTMGYALDGQLLGFSVRSFGTDGIIACAPQYLDDLGDIPPSPHGRCVYFEQDFNSSSLPLQYISVRFTETLFLGTDAMFTDVSGPAVFIGGGSGDGFVYGIPHPTLETSGSHKTPPIGDNEGYYGYHLERANFSDIRGNILMSGPVGSEHSGQVVPTQYLLTSGGANLQIVLNSPATLTGPEDQPDSYFGYDFAVLQLEKDGYDSVVVGCPLCNSDKGEVYVYVHKGITPMNDWTNFADMSKIEAPGFQKGRFGMQVENIGDIDLDGFDDLAVSAPYVDDGVVYIFRGIQTGLSELLQTIRPRTGIRGFGFVLTGNFDVDGNKYADFAVGGFPHNSTGSIEILRSSPVMIVVPSFEEGSAGMEVQGNSSSCVIQNRLFLCFNLTACFDLSTVEGDVPQFAFNYTLKVDVEQNRVILSDNFQTNTINKRYVATDGFSCDEPIKFVLLAENAFIPASLEVFDTDKPLVLESSQDDTFGGSLTPVLGQYIAGNIKRNLSADLMIFVNRSCGENGVCDPMYSMDLKYNDSLVYLASGLRFSFEVTVNNSGADGFGSFLGISVTRGIVLDRFDRFESPTPSATDRCETTPFDHTSFIECLLENPFQSETTVRARITLRPDTGQIRLNLSRVELNFTVGDGNQPIYDFKNIALNSTSIAGYNLDASFGDNDIQASFIPPAVDSSSRPVRELGVLVAYTITLSPTLTDSVGSTIPRIVATISWPTAIRDESGTLQPLLVIVEETSISATCEARGLYPYEIEDKPAFANISKPVPNTECPSNITCGILQCTFINLLPISSETSSTTPLNVLIQAILYGRSVRGTQNIPVYVTVESESDYPIIVESTHRLDTTTLLTVTQAVTEFSDGDSCSLLPFIITIIVSAVFGLVVVLLVLVAMGGKKGQYYLEHREDKKILELKKSEQDVVDGTFNIQHGTRTIPPPGEIDLGSELKKPKVDLSKSEEAELEDQLRSKHLEAVLHPESPGETEL